MTYKVLGKTNGGDLEASVEHLISGYLYSHYDNTITSISVTSILWEQWFSGSTGDYGIYFQNASEQNVSRELSWTLKEYDHYTDIHVFARSLHDDYDQSAENILFKFEKWIKKVIHENKTGLVDKGIAVMEVTGSRNIMVTNDTEDIKRKIISVWSRINYST